VRAVICDFCKQVYTAQELDSFTSVHIRKNCNSDTLTEKRFIPKSENKHPWTNYEICPSCTNRLEGYINGLKLTPESDKEV
jgi:hypothetical protein